MIDYLILILSTDWFLAYWGSIGIDVSDIRIKLGIQQGCRGIVEETLSGSENLYLGDCSDDRSRKATLEFRSLLRKWGAESETSATLMEWVGLSHEELTFVGMCAGFNRELAAIEDSSRNLNLDFAIRSEVRKAWGEYQVPATIYRTICLNSESPWDIRTRHFLSSPTTLVNQLWRVLVHHNFRDFWTTLGGRLTRQQLQVLTAWYRIRLKSIADKDWPDVMPDFMT